MFYKVDAHGLCQAQNMLQMQGDHSSGGEAHGGKTWGGYGPNPQINKIIGAQI